MPVVVHRLPGCQLHAMSAEALKIRRLRQLAIQPRRRNFQHIRSARHRIFDIDNRSKLAAELRTILVRHSVRMLRRRNRSRPVDKYAQHSVLTQPEEFDLDHFESARACHALRNLPELYLIKRHVISKLRDAGLSKSSQLKSGLSPTGVLRQS